MSDVEDRLRGALAARAATVEPSDDGLERIEAKLERVRRRSVVVRITGVVALAAAAAIVAGVVIVQRDHGTKVQIVPVTEAPLTTTVPATTTVATPPPDQIAVEFARTVLGMDAAVVDSVRVEGNSRTAVLHAVPGGPLTNVHLSATGAGWAVDGATTDAISIMSPTPGTLAMSPLTIAGTSTSFEGQISVEVFAAGSVVPLASTTTTGGSNGTIGPFSTELSFAAPDGTGFVVVGVGDASGHGRLSAATVVPVRFGVPAVVPDTTPVWPPQGAAGTVTPGFESSEQAALDFARNYLGMPDAATTPENGGEVAVRPHPGRGPRTIVMVSTLTDGTWVVLSATSEHIQLDQPRADSVVTSPVTVTGTSTAAEGTINGTVRGLGSTEALGPTAIVMGGSFGEFAPFTGTVTFDPAGHTEGVLVLVEPDLSGEAGMLSATVIPVRFG